MEDKIQCCPVCGTHLTYKSIQCPICGYSKRVNRKTKKELKKLIDNKEILSTPIALYISIYPKQYYEKISQDKFNTKDRWKEIFVKEELSKNPLFDIVMYYASCKKQDGNWFHKSSNSIINNNTSNHDNQPTSTCPKCPICNSTNIEKINNINRLMHGIAFGLFSKTARSQFECKNCGMKF